jgi:hypothetical protein
MSLKGKMQKLRYPFARSLIILSVVITVVSISFAVTILKDEKDIIIVQQSIIVSIPPLLLYFIVTLLVTYVSILVKVRLYASAESSGNFNKPLTDIFNFQRPLIIIYVLAIIIIVIIPILAILIPGIFWLIGLLSFIGGINLSEIIIYVLSSKD